MKSKKPNPFAKADKPMMPMPKGKPMIKVDIVAKGGKKPMPPMKGKKC